MHRLDQLWNGWRSQYVTSIGATSSDPAGAGGSLFTRILESGLPDHDTFIVHRGERVFAILNAYPYSTGHLLVLPYREVADLDDLDDADPAATAELWATVTDAVRAVKSAFGPEGVNVGINMGRSAGGSVSEHIHVHVVPRWRGDSNFMTTVANTATIPAALDVTAARIRAAWPRP